MKLSKSESKEFHKQIFGSVGRIALYTIFVVLSFCGNSYFESLISYDDIMKYSITKVSYYSGAFLTLAFLVICTSARRIYYAILDLIVACIKFKKDKSSK